MNSLILSFLLLLCIPAFGQIQIKNSLTGTANKTSDSADGKTALSTAEIISQMRQKITDAERIFQESLAASSNNNIPAGATPTELIEKNTMMRWLIRTYQNHITLLEEVESIRKRQDDVRREASTWSGFNEKPPYSILLADNIRDSIQSATSKLESAKIAGTLVEKLVEEARSELKGFESKIRQTSEKMESDKDKYSTAHLSWNLELQKLQSRVAAARISNYEIRHKISEEEIVEQQQKLKLLEKQLSLAISRVRFSKEDLDSVVSVLNIEQNHVKNETIDVETDYPKQQKALEESREKLKIAIQNVPDEKGSGKSESKSKIVQLQELVELRGIQAETSAKKLESLRIISDGINMERGIWEMRFASYGVRDFKKIRESCHKLEVNLERVKLLQDYFKRQMDITSNLVAEEKNRLQGNSEDAGKIEILNEKFKTYKERDELYRGTLNSVEKIRRLLMRWKDSLDFDRKSLSFTGRMQDLFTEMSSFGPKLWNIEVISVDDSITVDGQQLVGRRSITAGKIIEVLLTLFIGYFVCCFIAYLTSRLFMRRFAIERPIAELARRWIKFFLVMLLAIFSLVAAKIPLTVFAFAGGALAIGIGFGMQNLLKNFISGIILLIERPLRVGDVVDVGGTLGTVTSIGLRSSLIRNSNGIEIFIPNSTFLENEVINWTHSNRQARFNVKVGVAYGCSTTKVTEILLNIAREHCLVLKSPGPQVLLEDFGDNSLLFVLNYWIDVLPETDTRQIASDIRHTMEKKLGEASIAISFPRDIRIAAEKPLKIEFVHGEKPPDK
jgi:small-conductance mechanosensitive channel